MKNKYKTYKVISWNHQWGHNLNSIQTNFMYTGNKMNVLLLGKKSGILLPCIEPLRHVIYESIICVDEWKDGNVVASNAIWTYRCLRSRDQDAFVALSVSLNAICIKLLVRHFRCKCQRETKSSCQVRRWRSAPGGGCQWRGQGNYRLLAPYWTVFQENSSIMNLLHTVLNKLSVQ